MGEPSRDPAAYEVPASKLVFALVVAACILSCTQGAQSQRFDTSRGSIGHCEAFCSSLEQYTVYKLDGTVEDVRERVERQASDECVQGRT